MLNCKKRKDITVDLNELKRFREAIKKKQYYPDHGICAHINFRLVAYKWIYEDWRYYSGSPRYPISAPKHYQCRGHYFPEPVKGKLLERQRAESYFYEARANGLMYKGPVGRRRKEFLNHIIGKLEAYLEHTELC